MAYARKTAARGRASYRAASRGGGGRRYSGKSPAKRRTKAAASRTGKRQQQIVRIVVEMPSASGTSAFPAPGQMKPAPAPRRAKY